MQFTKPGDAGGNAVLQDRRAGWNVGRAMGNVELGNGLELTPPETGSFPMALAGFVEDSVTAGYRGTWGGNVKDAQAGG